jgi:hypothetical protein
VYRLLGERYLPLIALTDSCASPVTSPRLRPWPSSRCLCRLLSAPAANRAFSTLFCESFLGCLVPYHGGPIGCSRLLLPRCHRPSPKRGELASRFFPRSRLFVGSFSRLQTFRYVQAPKFARLPDRAHRCGLAAGRPRLLHPGRTCFVASARTGYASRPLRPEGRGNDCLKKGANCQTCCPISTTLEGRAARQRTVLEPFDNESHSRKAGAEVARHRCICQHQRGEGPRWIAR